MKIFLAQQNYRVGDMESNADKIIAAIEAAKAGGGDMVVFSELAVCGYPPRDFLYFSDFIDKCYAAIERITAHTKDIAVLVGAPHRNPSAEGKDLYNAAFFLADCEIKQVICKTCLPTYDVFDEDRYFEPASSWRISEYRGRKFAVTICEDIWNLADNPLYTHCPMDMLIKQAPEMMINLSASPFDYTHDADRQAAVKANVLKYKIPMFYCNGTGSQTEIVFDGSSLVFDKAAHLCGKLASFAEDMQSFTLRDDGSVAAEILLPAGSIADRELSPPRFTPLLNIDLVHAALILGIRDYFSKMGFKKAVVGSSGGIDSAVTLALACEALGAENVVAFLMPSEFSSDHSVSDALLLGKNLGIEQHVVPINNIYSCFIETLAPLFRDMPFSIAEENIQSRTRGNLLMAAANKFGYILLNTSNKSELATGYGTLYGDMAGGLGVLGDCYKMQVVELAKYINRSGEIIPENIISKPPSAELRPNQKDSDSLPGYEVLDEVLYQYIEMQQGPDEIKALGYEAALTDRILRMVNRNEYKRNQFCPIIRVSPKAFGVGRKMPIVGKYLS